jgi:hypothetical protein
LVFNKIAIPEWIISALGGREFDPPLRNKGHPEMDGFNFPVQLHFNWQD